jgi:hypothetical protein
MISKLKKNLGFSVLEAIIGLGIFAIFFTGSLMISSRFLSTHSRSRDFVKVKNITQTSFEAIQSIAYEDWGNMADGTYGLTTSSETWVLQNSPDSINNKFKRKIEISTVTRKNQKSCNVVDGGSDFEDPETKFVTTTISWDTGQGTSTKIFGKRITKWYDATNYQVQDKNGIAFTENKELKTLASEDSEVKEWDPGNITVIGPMEADFDGDNNTDIVYLKNKNKINIVDGNDERSVSISDQKAKDKESILAVENWNGSGTSTFYVSDDKGGGNNKGGNNKGGNKNTIYRVKPNETPVLVAKPKKGAYTVIGAGDIDGDDSSEFVFVDDKQAVRYIEPSDSTNQTYSLAYDGVAIDKNAGIGMPADFDVDGTSTIPVVNSSDEIVLVSPSGVIETVLQDSGSDFDGAASSPMASVDVDGDCLVEIVYISSGDSAGNVKYIDDVRDNNTIQTITDSSDTPIVADSDRGISVADTN